MKYACIDLETTGLDWKDNQTIEIGIVLDDWDNPKPIMDLPTFHCYVVHEIVSGNPFAMALNADILRKIGLFLNEKDKTKIDKGMYNGELYLYANTGAVMVQVKAFFEKHNFDPLHLNGAGKNFSAFDLNFLRQLPGFKEHIKFRHRALDPVMLYFDPKINKDVLPSLQECLKQAGTEDLVTHRGLADAYNVIMLLRKHYGINQ